MDSVEHVVAGEPKPSPNVEKYLEGLKGVLIKQGAEGRVYKVQFLGKPAIMKERFPKHYRHPILDQKITETRLTQEARCLAKSRKAGVVTPALYFVHYEMRSLFMEYIEGTTVRDLLNNPSFDEQNRLHLLDQIGEGIAKIHNVDLIHGDLTTSNMMINNNGQLVIIDYGLGYMSRSSVEDQAVDLYVLERAFISTHPNSEPMFQAVLTSYKKYARRASSAITKLDDVRLRGRKQLCFG